MLNLERCETPCDKEVSVKEQIEGIGKMLYETEMIMGDIISNIIGKPAPERNIPADNCLQSTFTAVKESAVMCMEMAKKIQSLIF